jgi:hypothetical protein
VQQLFGLLQVFGVEAFGEPAVDLGSQMVSFFLLALLLPQPTQAHHHPQLQRLRLLSLSNLARFEEAGLSFCLWVEGQGVRVGNLKLGT